MNWQVKISTVVFWFLGAISLANLVAALLMHYAGVGLIALGLKDFIFALFFVFALVVFLRDQRAYAAISAVVGFLLIFLLFFQGNGSHFGAELTSYRQVVYFLLFFSVGFFISGVGGQFFFNDVVKSVVSLGLLLVLVGFFERFTYSWSYFIADFFEAKNIGVLGFGYPFVFIEPVSFLSEFAEVSGFLRMTSSMLDPINFGHFSVLLFFLCEIVGRNRIKWLFFMAMVFAFSKAAMIQFFVVYFASRPNLGAGFKVIIVTVVLLVGLAFVAMHDGFWVHLAGLLAVLDEISVFGGGYASAGNVSHMFGEGVSNIKDSFVGALFGQLGLLGGALWVVVYSFVCLFVRRSSEVLFFLMVTQFGLSFLSENTFNFLSIFFLMFICGFFSGSKFCFLVER